MRAFLAGGKKAPGYMALAERANTLRARPQRSAALDVVLNGVAAARSLAKGGATTADVNKFSALAAAAAVRALGGAPDRPAPAVRAFLPRLDDAILLRELAAMLDERELRPTHAPTTVLHRPAGTGKTPALILTRLEGGSFGLLAKPKTRWQWLEGDKDHVSASIPDAQFAAAVAALMNAAS
jgi:hypothetical protein